MRWLVVLLFLALPVSGQAPSGLEVVIESSTFAYGPEAWKDGFTVDDMPSLTRRVSDWDASLGTYLDVHVQAEPRGATAGNDWTYHAWLSDGIIEVAGLVTPDPVGRFSARFDVDGQRALPGMAAVPALTPGTWTLRVRATTVDAAGNEVSEGSGQVQFLTQAMAAEEPTAANKTIASIMVPESMLPHVTELGPDIVWFNRAPHATGIPAVFEVTGRGIDWRLWWFDQGPLGLPDPLASPAGQWRNQTIAAAELGERSRAGFYTASGVEGLFLLSAVDPAHGGSHVWAIGFSDAPVRVAGVTAPTAGSEGPVRIGLTTPASDAPNILQGEAHALTITDVGAQRITGSPLIPTSAERAAAVLDGRATRTHQGPYRIVAMLHDNGDYVGHVVLDRGIEATLDMPLLGEGIPATGTLLLRNLADDGRNDRNPDLQINGTVHITAGETQTTDFEVLEGGTIALPFTFTPGAGTFTVSAIVDTGDTYTLIERAFTVLDADAYAKADKPWYDPDRYVPGPSTVFALLALALFVRKR